MYLNLKNEMDRNFIPIEKVAEVLGIHRNSASNKINGDSKFSVDEAFRLRDMLFPYADVQYLFKKINTINKGA